MLTARILLGLNVGLFSVIVLVTLLLSQGELRVHVLGWIRVAVSLSISSRPPSIIWLVIQTMSVEFMPFSLSFFLLLNAVIWFAYGLLKKDVFVALPNVLDFVLGVALMALYTAYRSKKPPAAAAGLETKLPEHVKEVQAVPKAVAAAPEGRASCGAKVHPIDNVLPGPDVVEVKVDDEANRTGGVDVDMAGDGDHAMLRPE